MNLFFAARFLRYLLFSGHRNGHGIHSPFAFHIVSRIFRNKIEPGIVFNIESIRKKLLNDRRSIPVRDLGAGSKKKKSNLRKVSEITRYSAVSRKYGILLSNMSKVFGSPMVLEFGTSFGISTMYMAASCSGAKVITMEGCEATSEIASASFREGGFTNIFLLNGPFDDLLPEIIEGKKCPGLVFIDGNHRKVPLIKYFKQVADIAGPDSVVVIDDINYSGEMAEAWSEIKNHPDVTMSVDIFRMGMVFFKKGLNHVNYVVRY